MNHNRQKILTNVLICHQGNQLRPVDIYFKNKILSIKPLYDRIIDWKDIDSFQKWHRFIQHISEREADQPDNIIKGNFCVCMPGAIDAHVHFNTPGFEHRETFETGSLAAASGGVTTVIDMPCTSIPPVTTLENLNKKLEVLKNRSLVDYALWGGVSGTSFKNGIKILNNIKQLAEAGVVGFKSYLISGMKEFTDLTPEQMLQTAIWIKKTGKPLAVHAEDKKLVLERQQQFQSLGKNDWLAYCTSRDDNAEAAAVEQMITISRKSRCKVHIVHLSSAKGIDLLQQAQQANISITAETCPHYLHFTSEDFNNTQIAAFLKTAPPIKGEEDRSALWHGLLDGTLSFVTTDHAGCDPDQEKTSDNFWEVYSGIPGVEHRVPFMFSKGFKEGRLTLEQTIRLLAGNPADYFSLSHRKGYLQKGKDADFTLINAWKKQTIRLENMHSKGKYTPFQGVKLSAVVEKTFLRGELLVKNSGQPQQKFGYGRWIQTGS